jgi:hypothetical protein
MGAARLGVMTFSREGRYDGPLGDDLDDVAARLSLMLDRAPGLIS